jgi:cell division protein FtsI (penicillin-binding protein 3)
MTDIKHFNNDDDEHSRSVWDSLARFHDQLSVWIREHSDPHNISYDVHRVSNRHRAAVSRKLNLSFLRRTGWLLAIMLLVCALCIGQLVRMQLIDGGDYAQAATNERLVTRTFPARRGSIVDANGKVLAQSVETYTIFADQKAVAAFKPIACTATNEDSCHQINGRSVKAKGAQGVAELLAPVLRMDEQQLQKELTGKSRYRVLRTNVIPSVKRNIDKLHISGEIGAQLTSRRCYPAGDVLGPVLGAVDAHGNGVAGVEKMANASLTGKAGSITYQRGGDGQEIPGTATTARSARNGGDVHLTIDSDVQWYVEKALRDGQKKTHAKWGIAIVQDVKTGKLVAVADTDHVQGGSAQAALHPSRAMTTVFEPGSTGKLITAANLLESGIHQPTDQFSVPYQFQYNGQTYHDSHEHDVEHLTLAGIIKESSNVGVVMASENLSNQKRYDFLRRMGIGQYSGTGYPGESAGLLAPVKQWDQRQSQTILFGQGYAASALQMTNVAATIANGGVRQQQSLISSSTNSEGKKTEAPKKSERVISAKTSRELLNMMESVTDMYHNYVKVPGYRVAGKSGTAQVSDGTNKGLNHTIGDWIGVLPADQPRFAVMVAFMDPDPIYGGMSAGPVMSQIGAFLMQKYAVPTSQPRTDAIPTNW